MKLLADESVDSQIVDGLRLDGHDVTYVAEIEPSLSDDLVLDRANAAGSLLLTADKDFGELVFRQGLVHSGVVLLRMAGLSPERKTTFVSAALRDHGEEMKQAFSVVSAGFVRIRQQPD